MVSGAMVDSISRLTLPRAVVVGNEPSKALVILSTVDEADKAASLFWFSSTISSFASSIFLIDVCI